MLERIAGTAVFAGFFLTLAPAVAAGQGAPAPNDTTAPAYDSAWWDSADLSPVRYEGVTRSSRYITMRDGVEIAIDVYLPEGLEPGARLPTIVEQTRYLRSLQPKPEYEGKVPVGSERVRAFVPRGYAYVVADVRGAGASTGTRSIIFGDAEVRDGVEVVDWIVEQPWSDGTVGATGVSYVGTTADLLLSQRHPAVKAVAPLHAIWDMYRDIAFPGGVRFSWMTQVWSGIVRAMDLGRLDRLGLPAYSERFTGPRPVDADTGGERLAAAIEQHRGNFDIHAAAGQTPFLDDTTAWGWTWEDVSVYSRADAMDDTGAAIYGVSGWVDGALANAAIHRFRTVDTPGSRLVLGPWNHGASHYYSPARGGRESAFPVHAMLVRFFDHHLKGRDTGIEDDPPVIYYTTGAERWRSAETWPVPEAESRAWYFGANGSLTHTAGEAGTDVHTVDVSHGTGPTSRWRTLAGGGPVDYPARPADEETRLAYTSAPLEEDVEVTGHPVVTLHTASTAEDGQFFVYLEEVDEEGRARHVTEGRLRAIHRTVSPEAVPYGAVTTPRSFDRADARPLTPGEPAELRIDLIPTSHVFRAGHRIRVTVAGADTDHFARVLETEPTITVHRGGTLASRILLPVVERE